MNTNTVAVWLEMEAKPGKASEVEALLKSLTPIVQNESGTTAWFAVKLSESKFAIFDTFTGDQGRQAHLSGDCAKSLLAKADELLVEPLNIQQLAILAEKV